MTLHKDVPKNMTSNELVLDIPTPKNMTLMNIGQSELQIPRSLQLSTQRCSIIILKHQGHYSCSGDLQI